MKILIVSGFLGAGKTTFIKELVRRTRRDLVVLENEYGGTNLDGRQLEQDGINIWEMTEGCVCCTMKDSFAASVLTIANSLDPEFLVIEPTGAAQLSRLLENIRQVEYEKISLLRPLAVLDWKNYLLQREQFGTLWADQLRHAGIILLSKAAGAEPRELVQLERELKAIAPEAELCRDYTAQPEAWFHRLLEQSLDGTAEPGEQAEKPESLTLSGAELESGNALLLLLSGVVSGVFGSVLRAKGCIRAGESWLRFDTVGGQYAVTGAEPQERGEAVFIGTNLRRELLRQALLPIYPLPKLPKRILPMAR